MHSQERSAPWDSRWKTTEWTSSKRSNDTSQRSPLSVLCWNCLPNGKDDKKIQRKPTATGLWAWKEGARKGFRGINHKVEGKRGEEKEEGGGRRWKRRWRKRGWWRSWNQTCSVWRKSWKGNAKERSPVLLQSSQLLLNKTTEIMIWLSVMNSFMAMSWFSEIGCSKMKKHLFEFGTDISITDKTGKIYRQGKKSHCVSFLVRCRVDICSCCMTGIMHWISITIPTCLYGQLDISSDHFSLFLSQFWCRSLTISGKLPLSSNIISCRNPTLNGPTLKRRNSSSCLESRSTLLVGHWMDPTFDLARDCSALICRFPNSQT